MHTQLTHNLRTTLSTGTIAVTRLPLVPEISLYQIGPDNPRGRLSHEEMIAIMNAPSYWAFCWASGQILARYLLDHPEAVRGKSVVDFGSGSGVVGIAAALSGASAVTACDLDAHALAACVANAELNGVNLSLLDDIEKLGSPTDVAIAADVLYDREKLPWLTRLPALAAHTLIADSRMRNLELHGYAPVFRATATTVPHLDESREFNDVRVYRARR